MIGTPLTPKSWIFDGLFAAFRGFRLQKPFQTARACFSIQAKPGNADVHGFRSDFDNFRNFGISDFRILGFGSSDFGLFGVRGLDLRAITSKSSTPGGVRIFKNDTPWISRARGSGFSKYTVVGTVAFWQSRRPSFS